MNCSKSPQRDEKSLFLCDFEVVLCEALTKPSEMAKEGSRYRLQLTWSKISIHSSASLRAKLDIKCRPFLSDKILAKIRIDSASLIVRIARPQSSMGSVTASELPIRTLPEEMSWLLRARLGSPGDLLFAASRRRARVRDFFRLLSGVSTSRLITGLHGTSSMGFGATTSGVWESRVTPVRPVRKIRSKSLLSDEQAKTTGGHTVTLIRQLI